MYLCAIANQKGGVGKTTTTHNLGVALARKRKRVLLIDLDAQGNLSDACGYSVAAEQQTVFEVLAGKATVEQAKVTVSKGLDLLPASKDLSVAELAFAGKLGRENLLKKALATVDYDIVLIDCPPSLGLLTVNAMTAVHSVLIPMQAEYYALSGLELINGTMQSVIESLNPQLHILGILLTFYDKRKTLNQDVGKGLREQWGDKVFTTVIRDNVALAEAPSCGESIFAYRCKSFGATDYAALAMEFLKRVRT